MTFNKTFTEPLINCLCGRIAALRGARNLNIFLYMPRFLRSVRLALHPAQAINRRFLTSALLLIAISAFAETAAAADFSIFVGAEIPGSIEYRDVKMSLDNSPVFGIRFGNNFVRYLGTEHTFAISPDFMFPSEGYFGNELVPGATQNSAGKIEWKEAKGFLYSSNLMLNFPDIDYRMVPFLTAGVGLVHQYGDRALPVGTKLAFNYGGGVKFPNLVGPLGARADLRAYRAGVLSKSVNMVEFSLGLMVSFGW